MSLIKGSKQNFSEDDSGEEKDFRREESGHKSGLIKASPGELASFQFPGDEESSPRIRGKLLKCKWVSSDEEDTRNPNIYDSLAGFDTGNIGFQLDEGPIRKASETGVFDTVTIPSGVSANKVPNDFLQEEEFGVKSDEALPNVDVEAIIAEAEQKANEKAAKIIEHAQGEAKKLIDQAKIYGEGAKEEARQEGFKQGLEEGRKEGLSMLTEHIENAKNLFSQIVQERQAILVSLEPQLAALSTGIAEKIIGMEIESNSEAILSLVRKALKQIKSREEVIIKVNPSDLDHVRVNRDAFSAIVEGVKKLEIEADTRVDRGGCLIETKMGTTDSRIRTQLNVIEMAFGDVGTEGVV